MRALRPKLDGFCLYIYGVVLKRLQLRQQAIDVFVEAVQAEPLHCGAWLELSSMVADCDHLRSLVLPDHWMKQFFLGHTYLELQLSEEVLETYEQLQKGPFLERTYLMAQVSTSGQHLLVQVSTSWYLGQYLRSALHGIGQHKERQLASKAY